MKRFFIQPCLWWRFVLLTLSLLGLVGCSWVPQALGMRNGHLVQAHDVLALPGERVVLRVRLDSGSFLQDEQDRRVHMVLGGQTHAVVVTDHEGFAEAVFVPLSPGDYLFRIEVLSTDGTDTWPQADLLVSCRASDTPIAVIDLDGTLMQSSFKKVLTGDPEPLPLARETVERLAQDHTIVYLTHRPDYFGPKSKNWLARHGFPRGPVLLSELSGFSKGSLRDKTERLHDLRSRFAGVAIGIGDQIADAIAYRQNGVQAILISRVEDPNDAEDVREQALRLDELPPDVQVVEDWSEIQDVLWANKTYPPCRMKEELLERAACLKARWSLW